MDVQNISVAVRARPLLHQEESTSSPWSIANNSLLLRASNSIYKDNIFRYATVFGPNDDNASVYSQTAAPLVESVLSGINCTLLAYGQTGSGKTHTILGSPNDPGVVPRAWAELFHEISCNKSRVFTVHATFLELYNEELRDLMDPTGDKLQVQQVRDGTCIIPGLRRFEVRSYEQIHELLQQASNNRVLSATKMNQMSSRSHALFSLIIESEALSHNDPHPHLFSTLVVVDLAGSERTAKSGTDTGVRRREREAINLSLLSLGMVISQLTETGAAGRHVNYRNSLLTRLLQVSLGGNARTCMICTITPSTAQLDESISTLRFASNATKVKNRLRVNVESSDAVKIAHLKQEVEQLKKQGLELQRRLSGTESEWGSRGAPDASWEAERSALVTDLEACRSLVRELQMENVNLQRQIKDKKKMEDDLLSTQQMVKELKKQNAVLTANLAFEREMQQQLQLLLARSQASLEDPPQYSELMQEISVLTMELQIITAQRDIKEGKCGTLAFKLLALQEKLAASHAKRNRLMEEVTELKEALASTQSKLQAYIHDAADRLPDHPITIISERDKSLLTSSSLSDKIMSWDADLVADLTAMVYNREMKLRTTEAQTEETWEEVAEVAHKLDAELDAEQQPSTSGSSSMAPPAAVKVIITPSQPSTITVPPATPADSSASPLGSAELREVAAMPVAAACFAPVWASATTHNRLPAAIATPSAAAPNLAESTTAALVQPTTPTPPPAAADEQPSAITDAGEQVPSAANAADAADAADEAEPCAVDAAAPAAAAVDAAVRYSDALEVSAVQPASPDGTSPSTTPRAVAASVPAETGPADSAPASADSAPASADSAPAGPQAQVSVVPALAPKQPASTMKRVSNRKVSMENAAAAAAEEPAFKKVARPRHKPPLNAAVRPASTITPAKIPAADIPAASTVAGPLQPTPPEDAPSGALPCAPGSAVHVPPPVQPEQAEQQLSAKSEQQPSSSSSLQKIESEVGSSSSSSKVKAAQVKGKVQAAAVLAVKHIGKVVHGDSANDSDGVDSDGGDGNRGSESSDIPDTDLEVDLYGRPYSFAGRSGSSEDDEPWVAGHGRQGAPVPSLPRGRKQASAPTSNVVLAAEQLQRALDETEAQLRQMARLRGVKAANKQQSSPLGPQLEIGSHPLDPKAAATMAKPAPQIKGLPAAPLSPQTANPLHAQGCSSWVPSASLPPMPTPHRPAAGAPALNVSKQDRQAKHETEAKEESGNASLGAISSSLPPRPVASAIRGANAAAEVGVSYSSEALVAQPSLLHITSEEGAGEESGDSTPTSSSDGDSPLSARVTDHAPLTALVKAALSPAGKAANPMRVSEPQDRVVHASHEEDSALLAQPCSPLPPSPLVPDSPQSELDNARGHGTDADVEDELASPSPARVAAAVPEGDSLLLSPVKGPTATKDVEALSPSPDSIVADTPAGEPLSPAAATAEANLAHSAGENDSVSDVYSPNSQADPDLQVIILPEAESANSAHKSPVSKALSFSDDAPTPSQLENPSMRDPGMDLPIMSHDDPVLVSMAGVEAGDLQPGLSVMQAAKKKIVQQLQGKVGDTDVGISSGKKPRSPRSPTASMLMDSNFEQLYRAGFLQPCTEDMSESERESSVQQTGRSEEGDIDYVVKPESTRDQTTASAGHELQAEDEEEAGDEREESNEDAGEAGGDNTEDVGDEREEEEDASNMPNVARLRACALFSATSEENFPHMSSSPVMKPSTALSFFKAVYMPPAPSHASLPSTPAAAAHQPAALLAVAVAAIPSFTPVMQLPESELQPPSTGNIAPIVHTNMEEQEEDVQILEDELPSGAETSNQQPTVNASGTTIHTPAGATAHGTSTDPIVALLASKKLEALKTPSTTSSSVSSLASSAESTPTHTGPKSSKPPLAAASAYAEATSFSLPKAKACLSQSALDIELADSPLSIGSSVNIPTATHFFRPNITNQAAAPPVSAAAMLSQSPTLGPVLAPVFGPAPAVPAPSSHPSTPGSVASVLRSSTTPLLTPRSAMHTPTDSPRLTPRPSTDSAWKEQQIDSPSNVPSATAFYRPHFAPTTPPRVPGQTGSTALQAFSPSHSHQPAQNSTLIGSSSAGEREASAATHLRSNSATDFFRPHLAAPMRSSSLDLDADGHVSGGSSPSSVVIPPATAFYRPNFVPAVPAPPQISIPSYSPSQALSLARPTASVIPTSPIIPSSSPHSLNPTSSFEPHSSDLTPASASTGLAPTAASAVFNSEPSFGLIPPGPWSFSALPERNATPEESIPAPTSLAYQFQLSPHVVHYPPPPQPPSMPASLPLDDTPSLTPGLVTISPPESPVVPVEEPAMEPVYTPDSETLSGRLLSPPSIITRPISPFQIDLIMDGPGDAPIDSQLVVERSTSSDPVMSINDIFPKNFVRWSGLRTTSSTCSSLPEDAPLPSSTVWLQPGDGSELELESIRQIQELQVWKDTREAELAAEKVQIESFGQGFKDMIEELSKEVLIQSDVVLMQSPLNTAEIEL